MILFFIMQLSFASYDQLFEYQSVSLQDKDIQTHFKQFDSEYSSHLLNYSLSLEQNIFFEQQDKVFIHNQGSVSSNEFLKHSQLKVRQPLLEKLQFQFLYFEQQDLETYQEHGLIEVSYLFSKGKLSAFIDLKFQKREDNMGLSYTHDLTQNHYLKLFLAFPYYDWNNRNRDSDEIKQTPYHYGFVGRYLKSNNYYQRYFEYGYRKLSPLEWAFETEYWEYKKNSLLLRYRYEKNKDYALEISQQYDNTENDTLSADQSSLTERFLLRRQQSLLKYQNYSQFLEGTYDLGIALYQRRVKNMIDTNHSSDYIPFLIYHDLKPYSFGFLSYGYDFTMHDSRGEDTKDRAENRFNLHWRIPFQASSLKLLFTFDIDDITSRPWEGGQGSFEMTF
jgi:hypothetical protein